MSSDAVLLCECAFGRRLPARVREDILNELSVKQVRLLRVDDLCTWVAVRDDPRLESLNEASRLHVLACRPRATRALLRYGGIRQDVQLNLMDIYADDGAESSANCGALYSALDDGSATPELVETGSRGWFPVVDEDRCSGCEQCFHFCLFGVYGRKQSGGVQVESPLSCKDRCPACARICPEVAIMFPKCEESPIDGTDITDETAQRERVRLDVEKLLGNDPYETLMERRRLARQRRLLKDSARASDARSIKQALEERARFLRDESDILRGREAT